MIKFCLFFIQAIHMLILTLEMDTYCNKKYVLIFTLQAHWCLRLNIGYKKFLNVGLRLCQPKNTSATHNHAEFVSYQTLIKLFYLDKNDFGALFWILEHIIASAAFAFPHIPIVRLMLKNMGVKRGPKNTPRR